MNAPSFSNSNNLNKPNSKQEVFRTRLISKLCIALVCGVQFIPRLVSVIESSKPDSTSARLVYIALPLTPIMALIIGLEYLIYRKKGPGILRYSQAIDIILLLLFIADWILLLISSLLKVSNTSQPCFEIAALYGFTSFSWKTLLVTFIVQQWQLKIIAPVAALCVATGYAIHYDPDNLNQSLIRLITQMFDVIFIIYCEDKFRWRMIWTNLHQEKWMQVNNFILNNIPENTIILDVKGETKFISEYCKSFIKKCRLSLETKDFLKKIKDLQQIQLESDTSNSSLNDGLQTQRLATSHGLLAAEVDQNALKTDTLENLVANFSKIRKSLNLQERHFLVYNAKLETERRLKSLEIKISFIQHFESEYIILILRDTTKRDLLVTLEETNKYKDQLLASVSHELRAPLNGNINLVETAVSSKAIPENIKQTLLIPALRSSKFLLHIINDILDMSQIKEQKLRLVFQSESIKETLRSAAQLVELQAQKKGIEFMLELDHPSLPEKFCTDHMRLSQIVLNLLNNAVKFTKEGIIKFSAVPINQSVKILVEDSGIGMNGESIKKLFSNYTHIEFEGRSIMNPNGVGLGLNIAFNLAKLLAPKGHKGITVESIPGQGSVFSLIVENQGKIYHLPKEECSDNSCKIADEEAGDKQLTLESLRLPISLATRKSESEPLLEICECPEILIVDDNMFNVMAFEAILNSFDVKYDSVFSGSSAIQRLVARENKKCGKACKSYSIIFMDQEMPEMNGSETVKEIRRLQGEGLLPEIKIIGCTAHKSKEEVERFLESGLDQCIHKPISASMVRDIL